MEGIGQLYPNPNPCLPAMATRLLSFLNDIEQALTKESIANMGPTWDGLRIVNYKSGLARLTLTPPSGAEVVAPGGTILLQGFLLADGSLCHKAQLTWEGSPATTQIAVYAKPDVNWATEARRIASTWLAGPPATATVESTPSEAAEPLADAISA